VYLFPGFLEKVSNCGTEFWAESNRIKDWTSYGETNMASLKILDHFGQAPQKVSEKKQIALQALTNIFSFFFRITDIWEDPTVKFKCKCMSKL